MFLRVDHKDVARLDHLPRRRRILSGSRDRGFMGGGVGHSRGRRAPNAVAEPAPYDADEHVESPVRYPGGTRRPAADGPVRYDGQSLSYGPMFGAPFVPRAWPVKSNSG